MVKNSRLTCSVYEQGYGYHRRLQPSFSTIYKEYTATVHTRCRLWIDTTFCFASSCKVKTAFPDVFILICSECGGKNIIQAHSVILSAASPKLYAYCTAAQGVNYTIVTPDVPVFVWRNVLAFIYEGTVVFA